MYHYTACGLRNVWLKNGFSIARTPHGEGVTVANIPELHRAIARHLIDEKARLTGAEFRFLRKEMDLSQEALAKMLGNQAQSVALWEKRGRVPRWADLLVRALFREIVEGRAAGIRELAARLRGPGGAATRITFEDSRKGWREAA